MPAWAGDGVSSGGGGMSPELGFNVAVILVVAVVGAWFVKGCFDVFSDRF